MLIRRKKRMPIAVGTKNGTLASDEGRHYYPRKAYAYMSCQGTKNALT